MYRILLADDEGIMLMSLRKMIETNFPDQFYGYSYAGDEWY